MLRLQLSRFLHFGGGLCAEYLKIAERTAYGWVKEGKLPGFKMGSAWRFDKADIQKWVQEKKDKGSAK